MAWSKEDRSFKILVNRRVTSAGKAYYEEVADATLDLHFKDVKTEDIPTVPPTATNAVVKVYTSFALMLDNSVLGTDGDLQNFQSYYAKDLTDPTAPPDGRLRDWISDKYGLAYPIHLYDSVGSEIFPDDASRWFFDYTTGILTFNGSTTAFLKPFKITGYRYIGKKGSANLVELQNDSYNYPVWNADITKAATRHAIAEKINQQDELIDLLSPPRSLLMGTLSIGGAPVYSGKIAANQPTWYSSGFAPGSIINTLIYAPTYTVFFNQFRCGALNKPETQGTLTGTKYTNLGATTTATHNMTAGGGNTGFVSVMNIQTHSGFWMKADGLIQATQAAGYIGYKLTHTEAGESPILPVFYDDNSAAPTFASAANLTVANKQPKWLSGVALFGMGSTFNMAYTVNNLFNHVYVSSGATQISMVGMNPVVGDPVGVPNWNTQFIVSNRTVTLNVADQFSDSPVLTVTARKPNGNNTDSTFNVNNTLGFGINTFGIVSTDTREYFQDESRRLITTTNTPFVSTVSLPNGEAQVYNGRLNYGNVFYTGKSGIQTYERRFFKEASPSGNIRLNGISYENISPYGTGNLNVIIKLETQNLHYDLGKVFTFDNGTGSGNSFTNSKGCMTTVSNGFVNFTFGTDSTANNNNIYRVIIMFRNTNAGTITGIETI